MIVDYCAFTFLHWFAYWRLKLTICGRIFYHHRSILDSLFAFSVSHIMSNVCVIVWSSLISILSTWIVNCFSKTKLLSLPILAEPLFISVHSCDQIETISFSFTSNRLWFPLVLTKLFTPILTLLSLNIVEENLGGSSFSIGRHSNKEAIFVPFVDFINQPLLFNTHHS